MTTHPCILQDSFIGFIFYFFDLVILARLFLSVKFFNFNFHHKPFYTFFRPRVVFQKVCHGAYIWLRVFLFDSTSPHIVSTTPAIPGAVIRSPSVKYANTIVTTGIK